MIVARFESNATPGTYWQSLKPGDSDWADVVAQAKTLGIGEDELLRMDNPGGASRYGRVRCLIPTASLAALYGTVTAGGSPDGSVRFEINEGGGTTLYMRVWLMGPRPIFWGSNGGYALVEGRDRRWRGRWATDLPDAEPFKLSDDGRYKVSGGSTMLGWVQDLATDAGLTVTWGSYAPTAAQWLLCQDLTSLYGNAPGLILDCALAMTGWCLQYDASDGTYAVVQQGSDVETLGLWMKDTVAYGAGNGRIWRGGAGATSDNFDSASAILDLWNASSAIIAATYPQTVRMLHGDARREGYTTFNNQDAPQTAEDVQSGGSPTTDRSLASWGGATVRPFATFPAQTCNLTGWDWLSPSSSATALASIWGLRSATLFGKQAWAGWVQPPRGGYRQTQCTWVATMTGDKATITTLTGAEWEDWTLGPDGMLNADPSRLVVARGNIFAASTFNGALNIRVAPPQVRVFMARVTGYAQVGTDWRWLYSWEEVEKDDTGAWTHDATCMRSGTEDAENTAERGNVTGAFIWPGTVVADYAPSTVEPLPIGYDEHGDGIVLMAELAPTVYPKASGDEPPAYTYQFCVPNDPLVTCA